MPATRKVHEHIFGNSIITECNRVLRSCETAEERMRVASLIRSKVDLDSISNALLSRGLIGNII